VSGLFPGPEDFADATIRLRLLREAPSESETRIIGYVRKPDNSKDGKTPRNDRDPLVGTRVAVTGSSGTTVVTTDHEGIYEVAR
jgi:hypothetical protein